MRRVLECGPAKCASPAVARGDADRSRFTTTRNPLPRTHECCSNRARAAGLASSRAQAEALAAAADFGTVHPDMDGHHTSTKVRGHGTHPCPCLALAATRSVAATPPYWSLHTSYAPRPTHHGFSTRGLAASVCPRHACRHSTELRTLCCAVPPQCTHPTCRFVPTAPPLRWGGVWAAGGSSNGSSNRRPAGRRLAEALHGGGPLLHRLHAVVRRGRAGSVWEQGPAAAATAATMRSHTQRGPLPPHASCATPVCTPLSRA